MHVIFHATRRQVLSIKVFLLKKWFSLSVGSGVATDIWTSYAAMIMAISVLPFIVVQLPQLFHSNSGRHLAVLIALIISLSLLLSYCLYQVIVRFPFFFSPSILMSFSSFTPLTLMAENTLNLGW